jgi:hypothetical protein
MAVYVDELPEGWGRWSGGAHMLATDLDELHALARRIGLRRAWFQGQSTFPHYDLTAPKRRAALAAGAQAIELGEIPEDVLMRCPDGGYEPRSARLARRDARRAEASS